MWSARALTVAHHDLQELDDDLGGRAQQHLPLAALLRVVHGLKRIIQHADAHHAACAQPLSACVHPGI